MRYKITLILLIILMIIMARLSLFTVDRTEFVYLTKLGRHVHTYDGANDAEAGLHVKWTWPIQSLQRLDRRMQYLDLVGAELLTRDAKGNTIELPAPVVHIWFFKPRPSRLAMLLDMKAACLEKVIYFKEYVVIDPGDTPLKERQLLTEDDYRKAREQFGDAFEANNGPFGQPMEDDGSILCDCRVEKKHLNGARKVHGGCLMTAANYALFAFAAPRSPSEFLDAAHEGRAGRGDGRSHPRRPP